MTKSESRARGFELPGTEGDDIRKHRLSEYTEEGAVVLVFYPFDFSPVCTDVLCRFRDAEGVEPDSLDISLEQYVSVGAIQQLVGHGSSSWRLRFETPRHVVEVAGDGAVLVDGEEVRTVSRAL